MGNNFMITFLTIIKAQWNRWLTQGVCVERVWRVQVDISKIFCELNYRMICLFVCVVLLKDIHRTAVLLVFYSAALTSHSGDHRQSRSADVIHWTDLPVLSAWALPAAPTHFVNLAAQRQGIQSEDDIKLILKTGFLGHGSELCMPSCEYPHTQL